MEALGAVNAYRRADLPTATRLTINLAVGVTPFIHVWDGHEYASNFYALPPRTGKVTVRYGHYRPAREEFGRLERALQDHVLNGGLLCAELHEARQLPADPVRRDWDYENLQAWCLGYYGRRLPPLEPADDWRRV